MHGIFNKAVPEWKLNFIGAAAHTNGFEHDANFYANIVLKHAIVI
jgi:hypothetical protein